MKKGYKKLFILQYVLLFILFLNSFVSNILNGYFMVLFLGIVLLSFKYIFGFERDRHRYVKDIIFDIIIFCLIFFLLYYLFGILTGFTEVENYYSFYGIFVLILPLVFFIIFKEILRYMMMRKAEGCLKLEVLICFVFILLDITNSIYYCSFKDAYEIFIFISLSLLPTISSNIVCTYLTRKVGYKPIILYLLIMNLYSYLLPIVPNPSEYIISIIRFLLPLLLLYRISSFFRKDRDEVVSRDYNKRNFLAYIIPIFFIAVIVYFTSGYFNYFALAIASGSMSPNISKGDIVIIDKIDDDYSSLKKGDVIAFKHDGIIVVHRLIKILNDDNVVYYYTQGDANKTPDDYVVTQEMIVGAVSFKIPFLGLPTVWLNEI